MSTNQLPRTTVPALETIHRAFNVFNNHDVDGYAATYAEDTIVTDPAYPDPLRGRDAVRQDVAAFLTAFPDARATLRRHVISGDSAAVEVAIAGTHTGPLPTPDGEIAPTGRPVLLEIGAFVTLGADGTIATNRRYYDVAGFLKQLGL